MPMILLWVGLVAISMSLTGCYTLPAPGQCAEGCNPLKLTWRF